ncbi:MAG: hypothetical protein ACI4SQ_01890 [Eubacterium sp.]
MKWFNKMEQKLGKYAISGLMRYVVLVSIIGCLIGLVAPGVYEMYLSLNVYAILNGQVWRMVTFLFYPYVSLGSSGALINALFFAIMLYVYYWIGNVLEQVWGSFRFNTFYFTGIFLILIATFGYYFILCHVNGQAFAPQIGFGLANQIDLNNLNLSMFLAFAFLSPDTVFRLYFLIPIKAKWLGYIYIVMNVVEIFQYIQTGDYRGYMRMLLIVAALLDFAIFYAIARKPYMGMRMKQAKKRRVVYKNTAAPAGQSRHKCAICGRTEIDSPQLEFRYCSKCEGNYEYCSDHLFTHEHVKRS